MRKFSILTILIILILILAIVNLGLGSVSIPITEVYKILLGEGSDSEVWTNIVLMTRLPQTLTAIACGAGLAVAGLEMQTVFHNPLAGPSVLGISSAASLGVAFVVLLSVPIFKDRVNGKKLIALVLAFAGCVLAGGVLGGSFSLTLEGLLLGLGSGLFYASYSIFARLAMQYYRSLTITFYTFLVAAAGSMLLLAFGAADYGAAQWTMEAALHLAGLLVIGTVAPYLLYTTGLQGIGDGGKASILASVEPVVAAFIGVLAFGEPLGIGTIGGLACILISVWILR